jgi:hypothetical protein
MNHAQFGIALLALTIYACRGASSEDPSASPDADVYVDQVDGREDCLAKRLPVAEFQVKPDQEGQVLCQVGVVTAVAANGVCVCDASQNLTAMSVSVGQAVARKAEQLGSCGANTGVDCRHLCVCDLQQASGGPLVQCQTDTTTPITEMLPGFCYVDAIGSPFIGDPAIVGSCPNGSQRMLRITGPAPAQPAPLLFLACSEPPI